MAIIEGGGGGERVEVIMGRRVEVSMGRWRLVMILMTVKII